MTDSKFQENDVIQTKTEYGEYQREVFESLLKTRNNSTAVDKTAQSFKFNYQTILPARNVGINRTNQTKANREILTI